MGTQQRYDGADANTAGTYDWGNNKTAICHGITTENSVDAAKENRLVYRYMGSFRRNSIIEIF